MTVSGDIRPDICYCGMCRGCRTTILYTLYEKYKERDSYEGILGVC